MHHLPDVFEQRVTLRVLIKSLQNGSTWINMGHFSPNYGYTVRPNIPIQAIPTAFWMCTTGHFWALSHWFALLVAGNVTFLSLFGDAPINTFCPLDKHHVSEYVV